MLRLASVTWFCLVGHPCACDGRGAHDTPACNFRALRQAGALRMKPTCRDHGHVGRQSGPNRLLEDGDVVVITSIHA
eukprot:3251157-Pyramimonas_sp.AAC.1